VWVFGKAIYVGLSFLIEHWRYMTFITGTVPVFLMNWLWNVYFESPRYYYPINKTKSI